MSATFPARILNVNDSASNRYYVSRVLRAAGWDVIEAERGALGLELARKERPDVVILDIKLPDMSGLEVCRMLRADPETADIVIVQTSATFTTSEGKARGLQSGADQYLTQPFEGVELVAMVNSLLRLRQKERELREKARALVEADRRKDEFLAMLAHELRNPLSAMTMAGRLLEARERDASDARLLSIIARNGIHLSRLIEDLLDVSRITRGKIQLQKVRVDVAGMVRRYVGAEGAVLTREHVLETDVADEPLWIEGDATRIEQIVSNLVSNAVKYTEVGGRIVLSAKRVDGTAVIEVRDSGRGVAAEHLDAIFDLFFQVEQTLARSQGGLGIGLTLVKRLVELHDGRITCSSGGVGKGAAFRVELPLTDRAAATVSEPVPAAASPARSLLFVDDNADISDLYQLAFEAEGRHVVVVNDGETGLQHLTSGSYDVAVVDIGLPGIDGYEVARRTRAARGNAPILIALTGYGRSEDKRLAREAGFDAHLVKPVDIGLLQRTIDSLAAKKVCA